MSATRLAFLIAAAFAVAGAEVAPAQTPVGTAFTYQGQLKQSGVPVDELADLEFTLWDADVGGSQVGPTLTFDGQGGNPPPVDVVKGLFTVLLDFGGDVFTGDARWLEVCVAVPSGSGTWQTLSPRQELTPVPHALALRALRTDHDAEVPDVIGGCRENSVTAGVSGATISGGGDVDAANRVTDHLGTIGGGSNNLAGSDDANPYTAGYATVGGGTDNVASALSATVAGGRGNSASDANSTVGGGFRNVASDTNATVAGGNSNTASGSFATVSGGAHNEASDYCATVPGGNDDVASGRYSFAAGRRAKANHDGAFVWADHTNADFASTAADQFLIRAAGGVGIGTNDPQAMLHVGGTAGVDGIMFPDGTLQTTAAGGSSGIYGSGTADYIPKFTASNTIGDSVIYETAGKIGIGTASPAQTLDVNGDGLFQGGDASVWYGDKAVTLRQDANNAYLANMANFVNNGSESNGGLYLIGEGGVQLRYGAGQPTGSPGLALDATGNVGIGTTIPDERLHVIGTVYTEGTLFAEDTGLGATAVSGRAVGPNAFYAGSFVSEGGAGVYGEATMTGSVKGVHGNATDAGKETVNYGGYFEAAGGAGIGVYGHASYSGGDPNTPAHYGGYFVSEGRNNTGVYGEGGSAGVKGSSDHWAGVYGLNSSDSGHGVLGVAWGDEGTGVYGFATAYGDTTNYGGYFDAGGDNGVGVSGVASHYGTGASYGGKFATNSSQGRAVYAHSTYSEEALAGWFEGHVYISDNLFVDGSKNFVHPHPVDPGKQLVYVCLEGGENGVYVRGSSGLERGRAVINLPEHFGLVAAAEGLTAQVTPRDGRARGYLYVEEIAPDRIVVVEANGGTSDAQFDYLVMGVRRGFEEHQVVQENRFVKPDRELSQEEYEQRMAVPAKRGLQRLLIENGTLTPDGRINQETAERLGWELGPETRAERLEERLPSDPEPEWNR
jgi:hypothetical protein